MFIKYPTEHPEIRIPVEFVEKILNSLGEKTIWDFYTDGGNHLHVQQNLGEHDRIVLDFVYNPGNKDWRSFE